MSVDDIATTALEIADPAEREAFLKQSCGDDESLRAKVQSLLDALELAENDRFLSDDLFGKRSNEVGSGSGVGGESNADLGAGSSGESIADGAARFRIQTRHAIGGLGEVWVAWDRQLHREVALKRMRAEWTENPDAVARFRREAEITGYLEHPGVVPIYSLGDQDDGRPFYAMQFIRGRTLEQVVAESLSEEPSGVSPDSSSGTWYEPATLRKLLDHFVDVCQTIDYAHNKQVVHRDLKPSNIMLGTYGQTLVVDWGLAKRLDAAARVDEFGTVEDEIDEQLDVTLSLISGNDSSVDETRQGTTLGTPRYMSPEQAAGKIDQIGPAADVYCLGATLYFILSGQAPHTGESDLKSTFDRIVQGRFDPPRMVRTEIPKPLQAIVLKAMAIEKFDRYPSAGELAEDVQRFLSDQPVRVFSDPPIERVLRWTRNHRALTAALAVALLLTFVGSITGMFVRQEMNRRETEVAQDQAAKEREIKFQEETRRLEAVAASTAALQRADAALVESRYADAAALIGVAIDRMNNQDSLSEQRENAIAKRRRLERLGRFVSLQRSGEDLDHLARDTEAAVLLQASLEELGVWSSDTWWNDLPDQDLTAAQQDRLRWSVYRILTILNSVYLTKMVAQMGGSSNGGTPSTLKMIRSYLSTNIGTREALATKELTRRIRLFRPSQSARWLGSIAEFRLDGSKRVDPVDLGPPGNPSDGQQLAIFSMIASIDEDYRSWFRDYGDTFLDRNDDEPELRHLNVALETLRRVSDRAPDDYWIRLTMAQAYYLIAQHAESKGDYAGAVEHYELARSEYGRCIALRSHVAFGYSDRSTVALRQASLMRKHATATDEQRRWARQLLQTSLRDASEAQRLEPTSHWVYWHVGATAAELGYTDAAFDAFFKALELGFNPQDTLDAPIVQLDDMRGRSLAIEFAYGTGVPRAADAIKEINGIDPTASRRAALIAALEYSRGNLVPAQVWADRAVKLDPDNARGHRIAGWCQLRRKLYQQAREHFEAAIERVPDDAVSLIGVARVAEQTEADPAEADETEAASSDGQQQSDSWYRRAVECAVSHRHRSTAWFGIARQALRAGEFVEAHDAIQAARRLDPACDVSLFVDLSRTEARRLLIASKSAKSESESAKIMERIEALKTFMDKIRSLPTASVDQITKSASGRPPRSLPLLGGDFELPLEQYWSFSPVGSEAGKEDQVLGGSPPLSITTADDESNNRCLAIRRAEPERATMVWRLDQTIPATSGLEYRVEARVKSMRSNQETATLLVRHGEKELARLELSGEEDVWTRRSATFSIPATDPEIVSLDIQIRILDPQDGAVLLDDLALTLVGE